MRNPTAFNILTEEIRGAFKGYDQITAGAAAELPYLNVCLKESLRFVPPLLTGMHVTSPGATVDGTYVHVSGAASPCVVICYNILHRHKVVCQSSTFALARNPRNFRHPLDFRPERWLPTDEDDPLYYPQFADDNRKGFQPFSQGPRMCSGREIAWWKSRVFIARVLWKCDDLEGVFGFKGEVDMDMDREAG